VGECKLLTELLHYVALDVLASQLVFEEATKVAPLDQVELTPLVELKLHF
jgi:hypothetical protein